MIICRALSAFVLLFTALGCFSAPVIKWDSMRHDFGAFNEDMNTVSCVFRGINEGDETLVIYDVRPNCGCTTTDRYAGREYAPGDSIEIRVTYNAVGRPGRFSKKVMIHSNAEEEKQNLTISGTVIAASNTLQSRYPVDAGLFKIHASTAMLGEVYKGGAAGAYFKAYNSGNEVIRPKVVNKPEYMDVVIKPDVIPAGEQFVISVSYLSGRCPTWGIVTDTITIRPDIQSDTTIQLTTVTTIKEDFRSLSESQRESAAHISVEPSLIDLGRISKTDGSVPRRIEVTNTGRSTMMVRRVYSPDPAVSIIGKVPVRVSHGKKIYFDVVIDPALSPTPDMINARITIISNDPDKPNTVLRVVGEITD